VFDTLPFEMYAYEIHAHKTCTPMKKARERPRP
jgi:hypothetical protein